MPVEHLLYSDFTKYQTARSRIAPGRRAIAPELFKCPRCEANCDPLEHGRRAACPACNLSMILFGNRLEIDDGTALTPEEDAQNRFGETAKLLARAVLADDLTAARAR